MLSERELLQLRAKWEAIALSTFARLAREEIDEARSIGRGAIVSRRWENGLLAVWEGAGDERLEQVEKALSAGKGLRDDSSLWRQVLEIISGKAALITETSEELAIRLDPESFDEMWPASRVATLAQTESTQAIGFAQHAAAVAAPQTLFKVWVSIVDDRTRPSHLEANGQRQLLDDPFEVGGAQLQWPADAGGPLQEVINCRCWEDYELAPIP